MGIKRGDIVICALKGDYGKVRPAVVVQSDLFNETHASVVICPITSKIVDAPLFRITIEPDGTGLKHRSQIMVDKIVAVRRDRIRGKIGTLNKESIKELNRSIAVFLGLA